MSETLLSEGMMVTLKVTAASNMTAGELVGVSGTRAFHITSATINNTAVLGYSFVGVLDESVSAGQCPLNVWTEGVFKMMLASGATDANVAPGQPVWCDGSGYVTTPGPLGDAAIGTLVGVADATWESTGGGVIKRVLVDISPMPFKWSIAQAGISATGPIAGSYPPLATR